MRKFYIYAFVFAAMMSCAKKEAVPPTHRNIHSVYDAGIINGHKITRQRAAEIAIRCLGKDPLLTKSDSAPEVTAIVDTDTLLHIVNFPNDEGFALVSTDDRQSEVLAYSEQGNFDMSDTTGNDLLKFHVDLIMAYEKNKREQVELGLWEENYEPVGNESDDPSAAMPELPEPNISSFAGSSGMPGNTTSTYSWSGNAQAIEKVERKYPDLKNFGTPVAPPYIEFPSGVVPGVPGTEDVPCATPPYCNPPIFNYDQYYMSYGCTYSNKVSSTFPKGKQVVGWSQRNPLNKFCGNGKYRAGCAAIAVAAIMVHHRYPSSIPDNSNLKYHGTPLDMNAMALYDTNETLESCGNQTLIDNAAKFVRSLGDVMDLSYTSSGTGLVSALFGNDKVLKAFSFYGYNVPSEGFWPYDSRYTHLVRNSIDEGKPVFIIGFVNALRTNGHCWVLDQHRYDRVTEYKYYFDEYGRYNKVETSSYIANREVHCSYGHFKKENNMWLSQHVYTFKDGKTTYDHHIRFLPGVTKP